MSIAAELASDPLGNYLKSLEKSETKRACKNGRPLIVRLDGRSFHTFTKGFNRPFDHRLSAAMIKTTEFLVKEFHAHIGYTQSDEITICWFYPKGSESKYIFGGRYHKISTILAASASVKFNELIKTKDSFTWIPERADCNPVFDGRAFSGKKFIDLYKALLWRERDAIKNSITMAASAYFSHKELHKVSGNKKKELLRDLGHPWEDLPEFFKRGSFFIRKTETAPFDQANLERIPLEHRSKVPSFVSKSHVKNVTGQFPILDDIKSLPVKEIKKLLGF